MTTGRRDAPEVDVDVSDPTGREAFWIGRPFRALMHGAAADVSAICVWIRGCSNLRNGWNLSCFPDLRELRDVCQTCLCRNLESCRESLLCGM